jgi:sec-independent protein translocase protein TatC
MATQIAPKLPQTPDLPPEPESEEEGGKLMTFFDHVDELRRRLVRVVFSVVIGMLLSLAFTNTVIEYMKSAYGERLAILGPADSVIIFFRVALMLGVILAMPIITYHLFMFVVPGLTRKERRWLFTILPITTLLFLIGLAVTWFVLIPIYINFLKNFQADIFVIQWTADEYITFVTTVLLWHGVAFETPVIFYALGRLGIVTPSGMVKYWRQAVVGTAIIAAIITPTVDPITMGMFMSVLLGLYVFSILTVTIAFHVNRRRLAKLDAAVS